jgi:hypothetical protein
MSFQWIIDRAETISINRKKVVASTVARDGTVRAISRGGQVWKFEVKVPDGIPYRDLRGLISQAEYFDRTTVANISMSNPGLDWAAEYQGNASAPNTFTATWTKGATSILTAQGGTLTSGFRFRAGDFIQLGNTGKVYTVAQDVAFNQPEVILHRPVLDNTQETPTVIKVGQAVNWSVICVQFPEWTLFARDQVSWNGAFVFQENLV